MSELCSLCQAVEAGPYCPVHGVVHRSFAIGERYEAQELLGAVEQRSCEDDPRELDATFVFGARDPSHGRSVAIAVQRTHLTGEQVARVRHVQERFLRETAALDTHVRERAVGITDFGWDDALGITYLVACRVDDPMLRPSLDEVQATLGTLAPGATVRGSDAATVVQPLDQLPMTIGSYDVIGSLGSGGTGRVYLGQHPLIGSRVAIKVLLPEIARSAETVDRFIQEARASSQIASPHIPRYFDFGTTADGLPYAIMEYFDGETLGVRLGRVGTMSIAHTAQVVEQIASALLMAHEAGLIHRDLKPDNILLVHPDGKTSKSQPLRASGSGVDLGRATLEVKVLDFGIAKVVGNRSPNRTLTGSFLGTPYYCAPEQVFGHDVDARTDVYSLGATAFEMLTGAPPFVGPVPVILSSKATEEPPDLEKRGFPPRVAYTIRRMLAREPRHRAPSMSWVLEQLASWEPSSNVELPTERVPRSAVSTEQWYAAGERTDVTGSTSANLAQGTTSQALQTLAKPRGIRKWVALAITGGVLAVASAVVLLGTSRSTASTSAPGAILPTVQSPTAQSPTAQSPAAQSPAAQSPTAQSQTAQSSTAQSPTAQSPTAQSPTAQSPTAQSPTAHSPTAQSPTAQSPTAQSPTAQSPTAQSPTAESRPAMRSSKPTEDMGSKRPATRRPARTVDKKPAKKPPVTKSPSDTKDVLIVDPFSSSRSDSR